MNRFILNNLVPRGGKSVKSNKSYDVIMRGSGQERRSSLAALHAAAPESTQQVKEEEKGGDKEEEY